MWCARTFYFVAFMSIIWSRAHATTVTCPMTNKGEKLVTAGIFVGPIAERVQLMPYRYGIDVNRKHGEIFYLGCFYETSVIETRLPTEVTYCENKSVIYYLCN